MSSDEPAPRWFYQDGKTFTPYRTEDSDLIEVIFRTGGTECEANDGKIVVDITNRQQKEKGTGKAPVPCVRATYFWQDKNSEWIPYTEATATILENAFDAGIFGVKLPLSDDGSRYAILNPNGTGKHHPYALLDRSASLTHNKLMLVFKSLQ
eukprot:TRINITY_DN2774_c0_g1_i2.p1 TRINITY_DN2774_c0_g1~~TRINITY_DN2774_c0_g1_i2.p1  ORF type:complete len:152 (-),score=16.40 TRINITY_DN2774_c0_g1_i2:13-468(-)